MQKLSHDRIRTVLVPGSCIIINYYYSTVEVAANAILRARRARPLSMTNNY